MSYTPTQRNHYNPCFWTALWNVDYYRSWCSNEKAGTPRDQTVLALNLRADRILKTSVERVHYDKNVTLAEITAESILQATIPLSTAQWTIYRRSEHHFPLCDSPVMIDRNTVMAVLSPRLLLEINLDVDRPEDVWTVRDHISSSKYREFRRRSLANTFKEIIFHDEVALRDWRAVREYTRRVEALRNPETRSRLTQEAASRVQWMIDGMGRIA